MRYLFNNSSVILLKYDHIEFKMEKKAILEEKNNQHFYTTPEGKVYPSITTILSKTSNKYSINSWKKRVGENVAKHISQQAMATGTSTHKLIESYLNNENYEINDLLPKAHFQNLKPLLHNICNIYYTEIPLYSDALKVAGTCDCIADYNGTLSIIDFKTSRKKKEEKWIENYFIQGAAYSLMWEELTGIKIDQIVILISGEDGSIAEFVKLTSDYVELLKNKLEMYYAEN